MNIPALNKILYVEDDLHIQNVVAMSLEDIGGFELKICSSGAEALKKVSDYDPDLFLLDIMMPVMDGVMLLKEIRKIPEYAEKPALFITAKIQTHEVLSYSKLGILGVIAKPFDPITISDTIRNLWEHYYSNIEKFDNDENTSKRHKMSF